MTLTAGTAHYLRRVLRLSPGDEIVLFNGSGNDYRGVIRRLRERETLVDIRQALPGLPESPLRITLAQCIGRGERMDYCLQKSTELGVAAVQPLISQRVEVKLKGERLQRRLRHWQRVMISACEQSGRSVLPDLAAPLSLSRWLANTAGEQLLMLDPTADHGLDSCSSGASITLLVGPEGGFSAAEIASLQQFDVQRIAMGPRILRTETAGPAAIAILQSRFGDM